MSVKLQMFFEVDLPTSIQLALEDTFKGTPEVTELLFRTGKALGSECPQIFHWLVRNGYMDCEMLLSVSETKNEKVAESVD